jgi:hypothetical protein
MRRPTLLRRTALQRNRRAAAGSGVAETSLSELIAVYGEDAPGEIGYVGRLLVQATMPHSRPSSIAVERRNGDLTLSMVATVPRLGLPYGTPPRHILAWLTTEAVRTRSRVLELGGSYRAWMTTLGVEPGGNQYRRYQRAAASLFSTSITCSDDHGGDGFEMESVKVAHRARLWWDPKRPDQLGLWSSEVELDADFYDSLINRPVPVDMGALRRLGRSPLAIDLYTWLTYRMSYLRQETTVPWTALQQGL